MMSQGTSKVNGSSSAGPVVSDRAAKILAKSFYRQLRESGYTHNQIVSLASEIISLVTQEIRQRPVGVLEPARTPRA
jgi:hypothetical protein